MVKTISAIYLVFCIFFFTSLNEIDEREKVIAEIYSLLSVINLSQSWSRIQKNLFFCLEKNRRYVAGFRSGGARLAARSTSEIDVAANKWRGEQRRKARHKVKQKRNETIHFWCFSFFLGILSTFLRFQTHFLLATFMRSICVPHTQFGPLNYILHHSIVGLHFVTFTGRGGAGHSLIHGAFQVFNHSAIVRLFGNPLFWPVAAHDIHIVEV